MRSRRLYLFDIDGTLIASGGAGSGAMRAAFNSLWRRTDGFEGVEFSGRTDRALFREALALAGLAGAAFDGDLKRFKRAYYRRLGGTLASCDGRVLPGVVPFLTTLARDGNATLALGTGNFRYSAAMKLRHYGLDSWFRFATLGGFGDRTEDRATLIAEGIRAAQRTGGRYDTVFVIGDTRHDIAAAKANGAVAVGVATGTTSEADLDDAGADIVLRTLEDAAKHLT